MNDNTFVIRIVVSLFNKSLLESQTLKSLLIQEYQNISIDLIIWDNSLSPLGQSDLKTIKDVYQTKYIHTPQNEPLSIVYNKAIEGLKFDYLLILDDDTNLPKDFIFKIKRAIIKNPRVDLFLPKIIYGNKMVSPAMDYIIFTRYIDSKIEGLISPQFLTAINSGMLISSRIFSNGFRYDTRLKFYGTDNQFMYSIQKSKSVVCILDTIIHHDLSFEKSSIDRKLAIHSEVLRAMSIIYSKDKFRKGLFWIYFKLVSIKRAIKYKTFKFVYVK